MRESHVSLILAIAALFPLTAYSESPGAPSMSFTSPLASQPANGAIYRFNEQPVTLTIGNATRTGAATVTYSVDVATDSAFTSKVYSKEGIPEGAGSTTTVQIASLAGNTTYAGAVYRFQQNSCGAANRCGWRARRSVEPVVEGRW